MYIERAISPHLTRLFNQYPIITITGPRQSGKTTLCKKLFKDLPYVSLEDLTNRTFAEEDPYHFLNKHAQGAIIDEVQRVPDLLSYIQTHSDEKDTNGQFVLTGSRQFELMEIIDQSLAGRTAIIKLLPFSYNELPEPSNSLEETLYTGFYPRTISEKLNPTEMYSFYTSTYIERDVRKIINVHDFKRFEIFIKLCAGRNGQVVNFTSIANDCGIDTKTVKSWLSILEASFIIKLVEPYYKNINKRIIKSPKLYFYDSGLVCYLLGIKNKNQLENHPLLGAIFESYVFSEIWKTYYNAIQSDNTFYFRDTRGREVDVVIDKITAVDLVEIKKSMTFHENFLRQMNYVSSLDINVNNKCVIYGGTESYTRQNTQLISWTHIHSLLNIH